LNNKRHMQPRGKPRKLPCSFKKLEESKQSKRQLLHRLKLKLKQQCIRLRKKLKKSKG
jgi:hypothetical protein